MLSSFFAGASAALALRSPEAVFSNRGSSDLPGAKAGEIDLEGEELHAERRDGAADRDGRGRGRGWTTPKLFNSVK
jgi:hypothetical protein